MVQMAEIEMFVRLLIPDTTALTALRTLHEMGFENIRDLRRESYYLFSFEGDEQEFKDRIGKVDVLVNANKNKCYFRKPGEKFDDGKARVLVVDKDDPASGLMETLKRLGFSNISSVKKGVLWTMDVEGDAKAVAQKAAEELFVNPHYQEYTLPE